MMAKTSSELVTSFKQTGPCTINVQAVAKAWDHRFMLDEYDDSYRFIKFLRKGSGCTDIKVDITKEQAAELIKQASLVRCASGAFKKAASWRPAHLSELDMRK
jgi:hypothetical protein